MTIICKKNDFNFYFPTLCVISSISSALIVALSFFIVVLSPLKILFPEDELEIIIFYSGSFFVIITIIFTNSILNRIELNTERFYENFYSN